MERNRAMSEMNGVYCSTRQMRRYATPKKTIAFNKEYAAATGHLLKKQSKGCRNNDWSTSVHLSWGRSPTAKQELPGVWSQQADPSQWSSTYYGYGQGYDAYGYGTTHDPSLYAYGAYPGYAEYPQQTMALAAPLASAWPNIIIGRTDLNLWQYQWDKHGTCCLSRMTKMDYFLSVIRETNKMDLLSILGNANIVPRSDVSDTVLDIANALTRPSSGK
ncbi:Ribonuclease S-4 [Camellia lanceoleosa]|uniref:Ribonuclease S-4 n=1 Tax=Camellia lanceoleosa TaxID=1840588 RepID=A0ACC0FTY1_9ERIC|nr:Ribonuclease S-4 [Camellia lanceoleosa]